MAEETPAQPQSKTDLFLAFTWLALQGFGGVLAVVQRELVEKKRWMTREQFVEDWAVAQIMPGPNVVNLSMMIGGRYFGLPGALAALAGMGEADVKACLANDATEKAVLEQRLLSEKVFDINATPSFIINGTKHSGGMTFDAFKAVVDPLLAK